MTGRVQYTPAAERHLEALGDWIAQAASVEVADRFVESIMDHVRGILIFPEAGRSRDDLRPGLRTTTYAKRTLVLYEADGAGDDLVINVVGVFHGGQDWEVALRSPDVPD